MLPTRLPLVALVLATSTLAIGADGAVCPASSALQKLEHDTGVAWGVVCDDPPAGTGYLKPKRPPEPWLASGEDPVHGALRFLTAYGGIFQIVDPARELKVYGRGGGGQLQAAFFTQVEGGIPVIDTGVSVEFDASGRIETVSGRFIPHLHAFHTTPALSAAAVRGIARADTVRRFPAVRPRSPVDGPSPELCIVSVGAQPRLAYGLTVRYAGDAGPEMTYMIDATSGAILAAEDARAVDR